MKRYRVWTVDGCPIDIEAKHIQMFINNNNDAPIKIRFVGDNDYILAEFYCDRISGWAEIKCLVDPS